MPQDDNNSQSTSFDIENDDKGGMKTIIPPFNSVQTPVPNSTVIPSPISDPNVVLPTIPKPPTVSESGIDRTDSSVKPNDLIPGNGERENVIGPIKITDQIPNNDNKSSTPFIEKPPEPVKSTEPMPASDDRVSPTISVKPIEPMSNSDNRPNTPSTVKPIEPTKTVGTLKSKSPPIIWRETQRVLADITKKLNGPVVSYYTKGPIVGDDVKYFFTHLKNIGYQEKLYFILISGGGDGKSAYRIASLLKDFCGELIVVIPEIAASAATMLSLAAEKIIMTPFSYLTAVDVSIVHPLNPLDKNRSPVKIELEEIKRSVRALQENNTTVDSKNEVYKTIFNYIHPVAFGALERSSNLSEMLCEDILSLRNKPPSDEEAHTLIKKLNEEYPAHGYPITAEKALSLGLPVEKTDNETSNLLWSLLNFYRFITEEARTDLTDSYFHSEQYVNIIESVGRRLSVKNVKEKKLDSSARSWLTLRDEYNWVTFYEVEENGEKVLRVSKLDF